MGGDKQSACRSSHRKPDAFQHMGRFSDAGSHFHHLRIATAKVEQFSAVWKTLMGRYSTETRTTPAPIIPRARAALVDTSMIRPRTNGPRSLMRHRIE